MEELKIAKTEETMEVEDINNFPKLIKNYNWHGTKILILNGNKYICTWQTYRIKLLISCLEILKVSSDSNDLQIL